MGKTAFLFPGQGAQYVGMGEDLFRAYPQAREAFETADAALGFPLSRICFKGPAERLQETSITQPAILAASIACLRVLGYYGLKPEAVTGLSLGEYSALVASGALDYREAVSLVHQRGRYMSEAVPAGEGGMAAIIGLDREAVVRLCEETAASGGVSEQDQVVEAVNFNCPGQVVIAGNADAVARAVELAGEMGARKAVPLAVSGPFHSRLMQPAAEKLAVELERVEVRAALIPVVANVTGDYVLEAADIRAALIDQVARPVLWEDGIRRLIADGFNRFIEVGPGTVLNGFLRRIDRRVDIANVQDVASLERLLEADKEVC